MCNRRGPATAPSRASLRRGWATSTHPGDGGEQGFGEMGGGAATQLGGATRWPGEKLSAASRLPGGRCGDPGARRRADTAAAPPRQFLFIRSSPPRRPCGSRRCQEPAAAAAASELEQQRRWRGPGRVRMEATQ